MATESKVQRILDFITTVLLLAAAIYLVSDLMTVRGGSGAQAPREVLRLPQTPVSLVGAYTEGAADAKVGLVEFSDFDCPFCAKCAVDTLPQLRARYVGHGLVRIAFRHFPNPGSHPDALRFARMADCAGEVGRFWQAHDLLFEGTARRDNLAEVADKLHIAPTRFAACMARVSDNRLDEDRRIGARLKITGTPTFFVGTIADGGVNVSQVIPGAQPLESFVRALDRALDRVKAGSGHDGAS
jgi:protein-disulfide isomerase